MWNRTPTIRWVQSRVVRAVAQERDARPDPMPKTAGSADAGMLYLRREARRRWGRDHHRTWCRSSDRRRHGPIDWRRRWPERRRWGARLLKLDLLASSRTHRCLSSGRSQVKVLVPVRLLESLPVQVPVRLPAGAQALTPYVEATRTLAPLLARAQPLAPFREPVQAEQMAPAPEMAQEQDLESAPARESALARESDRAPARESALARESDQAPARASALVLESARESALVRKSDQALARASGLDLESGPVRESVQAPGRELLQAPDRPERAPPKVTPAS